VLPEVILLKQSAQLVVVLCLAFLAVAPAQGSGSKASGCGVSPFSYAGLQSDSTAHGVAATLVPLRAPSVSDGHVGGWVGVGGTKAGPGGIAEWLQVGFAAFSGPESRTSRMYYEVTVPGAAPKYVELDPDVKPGDKHRVLVLEMAKRKAWWRVWVDGRPVSPPIHLPGSHGTWYPQAVAENWNGGTGACNGYTYRFSDVKLARASGGKWEPLAGSYVFQDAGYEVVQTSTTPRTFVATSL
jgi:hypothetical protein